MDVDVEMHCGSALAGSPAQSTPTEVVLEVLDVNEHAPEFLVPNPHVNATHNIHLSRLTPVGRVLMKVCLHAPPPPPLFEFSSTRIIPAQYVMYHIT